MCFLLQPFFVEGLIKIICGYRSGTSYGLNLSFLWGVYFEFLGFGFFDLFIGFYVFSVLVFGFKFASLSCSVVIRGVFFLSCFWEVACVSITFLFLLISLCGKCLPLWDCMFWFVKLFRFWCVRWSWTFFCPVIVCLYALFVKSPLMSNFRNKMAFSYFVFLFCSVPSCYVC